MTVHRYRCEECDHERSLADRGIRAKVRCPECDELKVFQRHVWLKKKQLTTEVYHTRKCKNFPPEARSVPKATLNGNFRECRRCSGDVTETEQDHSYLESLKDAAEGD